MEHTNKINEINRKYGEMVFAIALIHLMYKGIDAFINVNLDEACKKLTDSIPNDAPVPGETQAEILNCCCEMAQTEPFDLIRFIQQNS